MDATSPEPLICPRCGEPSDGPRYGPCPRCREQLRSKYASEGRMVEAAAYEPKMNVTPNAVAQRDD